ncbi:unnamed protein product [Oikopleura dioica]|uniref:Uncharacterized protein n=1 Tax=Oikopleura dioica TaxID=34765 RepID=E4WWW7_OIKDI|nr:unnamed protein product [Oikopleura dioica]
MTSKEDILKELPADVLNAKVSAEDLLKFSPVLQQEQQKHLQRQRQSAGEVESGVGNPSFKDGKDGFFSVNPSFQNPSFVWIDGFMQKMGSNDGF